MKKYVVIILAIGAVTGIIWLAGSSMIKAGSVDFKDATYLMDGRPITMSSPGIKYFGNSAYGDFNADGNEDVSFLFTYNGGGSGTFFYVTAALGSKKGYFGTNTVLLGDRIAPQTSYFQDGTIIVNYADRYPGEPMTTRPSLGVSKYLIISENGSLREIMN